jgi:hypothetical protein
MKLLNYIFRLHKQFHIIDSHLKITGYEIPDSTLESRILTVYKALHSVEMLNRILFIFKKLLRMILLSKLSEMWS